MDKEVIIFFENVLNVLLNKYGLEEILIGHHENYEDILDYSHSIKRDLKIEIKTGAYKMVFVPIEKNIPYVLKISLDIDSSEALIEEENYEKACSEGLQDFFAPVLYSSSMELTDNYELYYLIAKKIPTNESEYKSRTSRDIYSPCSWKTRIEKIFSLHYNKFVVEKLIDFLDTNFLQDIHPGNIGFLNDKPYIIDYS